MIEADKQNRVLLGQRIRELREAKGWSLRRLGRKVRLSAPFLSDLEYGRRSTKKLAAIALALGNHALPEMVGEYPARGVPWADFLYHRARVLDQWAAEGRTAEVSARLMSMDPGQVRMILARSKP